MTSELSDKFKAQIMKQFGESLREYDIRRFLRRYPDYRNAVKAAADQGLCIKRVIYNKDTDKVFILDYDVDNAKLEAKIKPLYSLQLMKHES